MWDLDFLTKIIARDVLSPAYLTCFLIHFARTDRDALEVLFPAVKPETLQQVYDVLTMYPNTDFGWGILPTSRKQFETPDLNRAEAADVETGLYQEDRPHVEYLRDRIRPGPPRHPSYFE